MKRAVEKNLALWPHQRAGVRLIKRFLSGERNGAALINMPTGTGKTGIIAVAAQLIRDVDSVLVICPRLMLREQLAREISGRFFARFDIDINTLSKQVVELKSVEQLASASVKQGSVFVSTFQLLDTARRTKSTSLQHLADCVDLVIVDEGHYEPAPSWRQSLSKIGKPTIVFTATPYRNDLKIFNLDPDYVHTYSLGAALRDRVVKPVEWVQRPTAEDPGSFVEDVLRYLEEVGLEDDVEARVMIRAESPSAIRQLANELIHRGHACVGIHETFSNDSKYSYERKTVPDPSTEPARFWIHQFKLLEGFDDPRFSVLALFDPLRNGRQLVQQVGRVLRNPSQSATERAHALDHSGGAQEEMWKNYLAFDEMLEKDGLSSVNLVSNLASALQTAQPDVIYTDGRFRPRFHLSGEIAQRELQLSLSVNVLKLGKLGSVDKLTDLVKNHFLEEDRPFELVEVDENTRLFIYISFSNSPLLKDTYFFESRLGAAVLHVRGKYAFYHDSSGGLPDIPSYVAERLAASELKRLLHTANSLSTVSLKNSDIGRRSIRRRAVSALNLMDIAPAFDDHGFVCATAIGYGEDHGRRYVGFDRCRVSDLSRKRSSVDEFIAWLKGLSAALQKTGPTTALLDRYARLAGVPRDPTPVNILLDIQELAEAVVTTSSAACGPEQPINIPDLCLDINSGKFEVNANSEICEAELVFDGRRYTLKSADLDSLYRSNTDIAPRGVVAYLNATQSFRVIPNSTGSFYTLGEFFEPAVKFGPQFLSGQTGVVDTISGHEILSTVGSEKGRVHPHGGVGWDPDSLFALADSFGAGSTLVDCFGEPDILVCDDMGTEVADFILADCGQEKRVAFIHAKSVSSRHPAKTYGASGLQDVCAQATKNLGYLKRFSNDEPPKCRRWHTLTWNNGAVRRRIRRNSTVARTGLEVWKEISGVIKDPFSDLEVWLLLGRLLSKEALLREVAKPRPSAEAQQAIYLLQSTMTDVASIGGRLRILCSP